LLLTGDISGELKLKLVTTYHIKLVIKLLWKYYRRNITHSNPS